MVLLCWWIGSRLGAPRQASAWLGVIAGSAVCIMREITQREYQWIEQFGHGLRHNMPGYEGLKVWEWNTHSLSETAVAIAAAVTLALLITSRRGS